MIIKTITPRRILNSAGNWTIETRIILESGHQGTFSVPGGLSKGISETTSVEPEIAITNIRNIAMSLTGCEFNSQEEFDQKLLEIDGTTDKSKLGGNTILSLSGAFLRATAHSRSLETYQYIDLVIHGKQSETYSFPKMMMLILEGGLHGSSNATFQEFMAVVENVEEGIDIYNAVKNELHSLNKSTNVGAEGAFSPEGYDNLQSLNLLTKFIGSNTIALDVAASSFPDKTLIPPISDYQDLVLQYPILSIEDPYDEGNMAEWIKLSGTFRNKLESKELFIVTDDLTVTNPVILKEAIEKDAGNAILIKPNQIGSITETLEVIKMAKENEWAVIISHRGTDTNDDFIADLAVGVRADFTKFGAPARGERVAKYNRLCEIFRE